GWSGPGWSTTPSLAPPPESRTCRASASATPKWSGRGAPVFKTPAAAWATAPSTQPPLTEPAIPPRSETAIRAPTPRGAEPQVWMTVARATPSPALVHRSTSTSTSRMAGFSFRLAGRAGPSAAAAGPPRGDGAEPDREVLEALQVVDGQEVVHVRQRGADAAGERLVFGRAEERAQPEQPVRAALQPRDLVAQELRLAAIPPVADDEHDRAPAEHAPSPLQVELPERPPDPRSPRPGGHGARDLPERAVGVAPAHVPRDPGEAGAEDEGLGRAARPRGEAVDEEEEEPRVTLHRSADVGEDDDRPR